MASIRIYELSKTIDVSNKELLAKLAEFGIEAKSHMSKIDEDAAKKLTAFFKGKKAPVTDKPSPAPKAKKTSAPAKSRKKEAAKTPAAPKPVKEGKAKVKKTPEKIVTAEETAPADEDEVIVPDKFKKEVDSTKLAKFKSKPGMQRAFDSMRRVEVTKKGFDFRPRFKKHDRRSLPKKSDAIAPPATTAPRKRVIKFSEGTTVKEFAELIAQKLNDVIKKFMELGYMPTINQPVDADAAQIVAESFGIKIELTQVESEEDLLEDQEVDESKLSPRPPIVTIMEKRQNQRN